ncbi:hypothetical protein C8J57DRAFT_1505338 [Mycena rebaudengoi]|nr:hypothetical protein C8J57DRAFT_1505338 [Mycena rebaudengoi]
MVSSHIETVHHTWLVDELPEVLRFKDALGFPKADEPVPNWQVVPRTHSAKLNWAYVGANPSAQDPTRSILLIYKYPHLYPNSPENIVHSVSIRIQGFVDKCNLRTLGNWEGSMAPQAAVQFITLSGGGIIDDQFLEYKQAVDEVVQYIYKSLNAEAPVTKWDESHTLHATRRVFSKV